MATERLNFSQFSALPEQQRYFAFAQLLRRNEQNKYTDKKDAWTQAWSKEDAQIVIGLSNQPSERYPTIYRTNAHTTYSLLDDYLNNTTVQDNLHGSMLVGQLLVALGADNRDRAIGGNMVEALRMKYGNPSIPSPTNLAARKTFKNCGHMFWKNRNHGQRAGEIFLAASGVSAIVGAVSAQSTALTTAGTAMAKFLPEFVATFGASHAIPPAALAFYALAATLAAAALVLLLASTLYRHCAKGNNTRPTYLLVN